jgi:hypothetical protein
MSPEDLPYKAAAVVLWLPKGETPKAEDFAIGATSKAPPHPNPEAWWELGQAVISARRTLEPPLDKLP